MLIGAFLTAWLTSPCRFTNHSVLLIKLSYFKTSCFSVAALLAFTTFSLAIVV